MAYRFSQPEESASVVLPQTYNVQQRAVRIPIEPKTVGDHIRRKRLAMKLHQKPVAERPGVDASTLARWERGEREPLGTMATRAERFLQEEAMPFQRGG